MPKYGRKLEFGELLKHESGLSKIASSKTDSKVPGEEKFNEKEANEILFVANPQFPYTRQTIRARPRLFNLRKESKSTPEPLTA